MNCVKSDKHVSQATTGSFATIIELPYARQLLSDFASEILHCLSHFSHNSGIRPSSQDLCWDCCSSLVLGNFERIEAATISASQSKTRVISEACRVLASGSSGRLSPRLSSEVLLFTFVCVMGWVGQIKLCPRAAGEAHGPEDQPNSLSSTLAAWPGIRESEEPSLSPVPWNASLIWSLSVVLSLHFLP